MICKHKALFNLLVVIAFFLSCGTTGKNTHASNTNNKQNVSNMPDTAQNDGLLESILNNYPQYFAEILKNRNDLNVQVIYTQVNRGANGRPILQNHNFNVNAARYYYPASTVKLPIVLLALQKLHEINNTQVTPNTTMLTGSAFTGQSDVYNDPTTPDGRPTIAHYIKKILMVSDNDAFNRLYEFLGQQYINDELKKKGYSDAQVIHRLDIFLSEEENRRTNPITFYDSAGNIVYVQKEQRSNLKYNNRNDSLGKSYYSAGKLINRPMDFSKKNRLCLQDLHNILLSLVFPEKVEASKRFNISEDDRRFVLKYMSQYPTESIYPPYSADTINYWPAYCKFLFYGGSKENPQANIRIFNKVGDAYGQLIDAAYIVDYKNKIEFFLSAVIYCNSDGIINDDKYDYDSLGLPFMKNLGQVIYNYELKRHYKNKPDLSPVLFTYDK